METIKIATLNIAAASKERARKIIDDWILPLAFEVYVLTETSEGTGTQLIISELQDAGWAVFQRPTHPKDRGVAIVSRIGADAASTYPVTDPAPGRSVIIELQTTPQIQLIGMYVPNRGNDPSKTERKRVYLNCWLRYLMNKYSTNHHRILIGDLNVVPTSQDPQFLPQEQFEYDWYRQLASQCKLYDAALRHNPSGHESTWIAHTGEGYTYDHIMPDELLSRRVTNISYDHSTRSQNGLTDHSGLVLSVAVDAVTRLDLASRAVPTKQGSLF